MFCQFLQGLKKAFILLRIGQLERHARVSDRAAERFLISDYLGHAGNTRYQGA